MAKSGKAGFLFISGEELARAKRRISEPLWREAAEALRGEAERLLAEERPLAAFDASWYDARPERDFGETYVQFHAYMQPAYSLAPDLNTLLRAGAVLADERYLALAQRWAMHLVDQLKFHVEHHDAGLSYSLTGVPLAEARSVLAARLSAAERERYDRQLENCGEAIRRNTQHWLKNLARMPYNNHFMHHRLGLLTLGVTLGRADWIAQALGGERGFAELLAGATMDDGLCYESSTVYHYMTLKALLAMAELMRHRPELGRDLYRETVANGRTLKDMFDGPLGLLLPTGELPAFGDCYARRQPLWNMHAAFYEIAFAVYGDPRYAWLLAQAGPRTTAEGLLFGAERLEPALAPQTRSRVWIEHGYALLTNRKDDDYWWKPATGLAAVMTGDASGIHHHRDKPGVAVAANGRVWVEDVESEAVEVHGFSAPIQTAFNRTMLAHNCLVVDEMDQATIETPLVVTEFRAAAACRLVTMSDATGELYPGVRLARTLIVGEGYCLDVFQAASDKPHVYDWLLHPRADGPAATGLEFVATTLPDRTPYSVLREAAVATAPAAGVTIEWSQGSERFCADIAAMASEADGELIRALWPVRSDWGTGGREMFMFRRRAARVDIVALYQMATKENRWRMIRAERLFNGQFDEVRLTVGDGRERREHVVRGI